MGSVTHKKRHRPPSEWNACYDGHHEMHISPRRPRKPEQSDGDPERAHHAHVEPLLGRWLRRRTSRLLLLVHDLIDERESEDGQQRPDEDAQERQPDLAGREVVDVDEHERVAIEERKQHAKHKRVVQGPAHHDRLRSQHLQGPP